MGSGGVLTSLFQKGVYLSLFVVYLLIDYYPKEKMLQWFHYEMTAFFTQIIVSFNLCNMVIYGAILHIILHPLSFYIYELCMD